MLKFNLTQEGKTLIDALQNNDKLAITHVRLLQSGDSPSVDLPISRGAIVVDGTCNGPYAVVDVNDTSVNNYLASAVALLSDTKSIAELYSDENTSGYEVVLSAGMPGRTEYPSIKYRTQTWASKKIPTRVDIMKGASDDCDILLSFGSKGGDPSQQEASAQLTLGDNFPKTITFSNGDIWETDDTVSTNGVKNGSYSYGASSEDGETSIRPLYSKISIQKESNKQLKLRLSCQFDGAEKCKFNTTSINLPYATKFREGVVRFADPSIYGTADGQRYNTVYSAADVDAKISQVTESLGNLDQYAKKAEPNEFTAANNTFANNITVNGEIGGAAVTHTDGDKHIVSVGYADDKYLSKTTAETAYLTKNEAGTIYLTQANAETKYLTQTDATATYLTKEAAEQAAGNYAKLNADNNFAANTTNTFNGDVTVKGTFVVGESQEAATFVVTHDGTISGTAIQSDKVSDPASYKLPTEGAVKSALNDVESALTTKDNDLQSQIDGINAGQNLADIVDTTETLAAYDVSHLKAKGDYQHGSSGAQWKIGDKVQVLGGADVQSSVYELVKGTKPESESNSIQSTKNANYYWHYIGVYGINAYTKSEIDTKVGDINNVLDTKANQSYVATELVKKVDKDQITTTIPDDTSANGNIPSVGAVKTYVDTVANNLPSKYVTLGTDQEINGAKTFANGNITIANKDHKTSHYITISSADTNDSGYKSGIFHNDFTHNDFAEESFIRSGSKDNTSYTRSLSHHDTATDRYTFGSRLEQFIGYHYNYIASDMYMTTGDPNKVSPLPGAQIGTPGNTGSTDDTLTENYVERIRLRKNTSNIDDAQGGFLPKGQSVTDIDLFADNINNVFNNEVSFRVCTTSGNVKTDKSVLEIRGSGVYYHTPEGNSISTAEYQLRTAGSLDFETSITNEANDSHLPTSLAVKNYVATTVDDKIKDLQLGSSYLKLTSNDKQTVASNVDFNGTIGGTAVVTRGLELNGTRLPTEGAVVSFVDDKLVENRSDISDKTKVGAMGLFLYTGDQKSMGDEVAGTSLQAVGMQLPMDGVVSWSQGAAMEGTWKLLNNTIAGEPCLVLAIRTV